MGETANCGARYAALMCLERYRRDGAWSGAGIDGMIKKYGLDRRDAALTARLCLGVLQNSSFRALFLEKCALMLEIFAPDKMIARIDELAANIKTEMEYDTAKWGVIRFVTWETRVEGLRDSAKNAPEYFLYYAQQYFNLSDAEMAEIFGRRSSLTEVR